MLNFGYYHLAYGSYVKIALTGDFTSEEEEACMKTFILFYFKHLFKETVCCKNFQNLPELTYF